MSVLHCGRLARSFPLLMPTGESALVQILLIDASHRITRTLVCTTVRNMHGDERQRAMLSYLSGRVMVGHDFHNRIR